jgi:hypothetical protein
MTAAARRDDLRVTARIGAAILAATVAVAALVHLVEAAPARDFLGFTFPGVPARVGEAVAIFAHNTRIAGAAIGFALVNQTPWLIDPDAPAGRRRITTLCDVVVSGVAAQSLLVSAAALGAYGDRMVAAIMPHGPLELVAFSLALCLYAQSRRARLAPSRAAVLVTASLTVLAVAALVETFLAF